MDELEVELIPILDDNYVFLIQNKLTGKVALVDPGQAQPCLKSLKQQGLVLDFILITHHHHDHIDGIQELRQNFPKALLYAPEKNKVQIPNANFYLKEGDHLKLEGLAEFEVIGLPGHTLGHIAYFQSQKEWLFSGDVLFGLGCGRLFEGTPQAAFESLQKIKKMPDEIQVFCTHEYTQANLNFLEQLIENNRILVTPPLWGYKKNLLQKRAKSFPSVPLKLGDEKSCNPFLQAEKVEDFAELRLMRNTFKPKESI